MSKFTDLIPQMAEASDKVVKDRSVGAVAQPLTDEDEAILDRAWEKVSKQQEESEPSTE
jgi:hypothetical protein